MKVISSRGTQNGGHTPFEQTPCHRRSRRVIHLTGLERLIHAVKLCEDGMSGSRPLPRSGESILVSCDWTHQDLLEQREVSEEEPEQTGAYACLTSNVIHVADKVHLKWDQLGADIAGSMEGLQLADYV